MTNTALSDELLKSDVLGRVRTPRERWEQLRSQWLEGKEITDGLRQRLLKIGVQLERLITLARYGVGNGGHRVYMTTGLPSKPSCTGAASPSTMTRSKGIRPTAVVRTLACV